MAKRVHYTWKDIEHMIVTINNLMYADNWRPDYIVGLTRGGLVPAVIMSNMTGIPMHTLDVRFRDTGGNLQGPESNLWMAEEAFGVIPYEDQDTYKSRWDVSKRKNILIFDDINDSGKTMNWIKEDWKSSCFPAEQSWETVWGRNVRFATLLDNAGSTFHDVDYTAMEIDKREQDSWIVFPWECERDYGNF